MLFALVAVPDKDPFIVPVEVNVPSTLKFPPTLRFLPIPAPPLTTNAPDVVALDCEVLEILSAIVELGVTELLAVIFTFWLNVTGPSNWERTWFESPPSTTNLSLIVTSSNTALNLDGSSPVTVGTGISKLVSSPVAEDFFWLPIKKSPLLFIPV